MRYDMDRQPPDIGAGLGGRPTGPPRGAGPWGRLRGYRLVRRSASAAEPPILDHAQAQVVGHSGGPLLVLAGPGTGKTTAIVETAVDRIARRGLDPGRVLALTFSRKAAQELRARITLRLNQTTTAPLAV